MSTDPNICQMQKGKELWRIGLKAGVDAIFHPGPFLFFWENKADAVREFNKKILARFEFVVLYRCELKKQVPLNTNKLELYPEAGHDPDFTALNALLAKNEALQGFYGDHDASDSTKEVMLRHGKSLVEEVVLYASYVSNNGGTIYLSDQSAFTVALK